MMNNQILIITNIMDNIQLPIAKPYTSDKLDFAKLRLWFAFKIRGSSKVYVCNRGFVINFKYGVNEEDKTLEFGQFITSTWFSHMVKSVDGIMDNEFKFYTIATDSNETHQFVIDVMNNDPNPQFKFKIFHSFKLYHKSFYTIMENVEIDGFQNRFYISSETDKNVKLSIHIIRSKPFNKSNEVDCFKYILSTPSVHYDVEENGTPLSI